MSRPRDENWRSDFPLASFICEDWAREDSKLRLRGTKAQLCRPFRKSNYSSPFISVCSPHAFLMAPYSAPICNVWSYETLLVLHIMPGANGFARAPRPPLYPIYEHECKVAHFKKRERGTFRTSYAKRMPTSGRKVV